MKENNNSHLSNSDFKAGFVSVMGKPNVGKSTLINTIIGQKITAVSSKPQTTRKRQLGILSSSNAQICFMDTPGIHEPRYKLGVSMNQEAIDTMMESDAILWVVDVRKPPTEDDNTIAGHIEKITRPVPVIIALNKIDLVDHETRERNTAYYQALNQQATIIPVSAIRGENVEQLINQILAVLPEGFPFYPEDQITDLYEREIAADLIREACLKLLRDEIPHGIAIRIDQYKEREEHGALIEATIFVEKESHKPIVIGKGGSMLKQIGIAARKEIELMSGRKVYLSLRVKVRKNWRNDDRVIKRFGF